MYKEKWLQNALQCLQYTLTNPYYNFDFNLLKIILKKYFF